MAETTAERVEALQSMVGALASEHDDVKVAALTAAGAPPVPSPSGADVGWLWKALVVGLLILTGMALVGVLYAALDGKASTDADKALIVFTPLLSGLLALFVTSPTAGSGDEQ